MKKMKIKEVAVPQAAGRTINRRKNYVLADVVKISDRYKLEDVPFLIGAREIKQAYGIPIQFVEKKGHLYLGPAALELEGWMIWDKRQIHDFNEAIENLYRAWTEKNSIPRKNRRATPTVLKEKIDEVIARLANYTNNSGSEDFRTKIYDWEAKYRQAFESLKKILTEEENRIRGIKAERKVVN